MTVSLPLSSMTFDEIDVLRRFDAGEGISLEDTALLVRGLRKGFDAACAEVTRLTRERDEAVTVLIAKTKSVEAFKSLAQGAADGWQIATEREKAADASGYMRGVNEERRRVLLATNRVFQNVRKTA